MSSFGPRSFRVEIILNRPNIEKYCIMYSNTSTVYRRILYTRELEATSKNQAVGASLLELAQVRLQ